MNFKPYHHQHHLYFVTGTIINWIPLFKNYQYANICLDALSWHRKHNRLKLFAYAIMPNHIHWISGPTQPYTINKNIQSFSSFTAHKILSTAREYKHNFYINEFSKYAKPEKNHRIWLSFQAKNIFTDNFLWQKLEYIHNNPVSCIHIQIDDRAKYKLSSACYYDLGKSPLIKIDDVNDYISNI